MTTRNSYLTKVLVALTFSLILSLLLISTSVASVNPGSLDQDDPYRTEEFAINAPGELQVRTSGGHITVEGSNSNTVRVEMYVRKDGKNLTPSDTNLDKWEIDISQSGNSVKAIARHKANNNWSSWNNDRPSISFVVYTPKEISSDLKTSGGHIEAKNLEGDQTITTSGGHLNLANLKGKIEAKTSGGHIDLSNIEGDTDVRTSGGHISANTVAGTLQAKTSGGHIKLLDISGSIEAATSGGSITANLNKIDQFVDLKTSGGNVDLSIPDNIGVDLRLKGTFVHGKLNNFSGEMENNEVEGKLNGGGPKVTARTSGGTVRLSFN
ncbi:DUF4097 family beta strand repeat-containing protein [Fodinibius sp.]|uniref:DUF4097 family beta strand repeat-containing protein n=1 Tax=Fodinibius sp. TaxID=1872440 RepID=UPI002ACECC02|nr:DUF4097 family beta strand repeat-containing protein [Fodinibius sp.]MDZ7659868.1 DUF4097 family beta strand repeat-containing protein [Fodinibius sp.]